MTIDLDATDRAIIRSLQENGAQSAKDVGAKLGLSQPTAWRRIKKLEDAGVIKGRSVVLNRSMLGFEVVVYLGVKLATRGRVSLEDFERAVAAEHALRVQFELDHFVDLAVDVDTRVVQIEIRRPVGTVRCRVFYRAERRARTSADADPFRVVDCNLAPGLDIHCNEPQRAYDAGQN